MIQRVIANFNVRVAALIQKRGVWIEYVMHYLDLTDLSLLDLQENRWGKIPMSPEHTRENILKISLFE